MAVLNRLCCTLRPHSRLPRFAFSALLQRPASTIVVLTAPSLACRGQPSNATHTALPTSQLVRCRSFRTTAFVMEKSEQDDESLKLKATVASKLRERLATLHARENIYTLPNILTLTRLVAAPAVGYLVLHDAHAWALGLFIYAGVTDLVDGWIARRWKLQTVVGSVIDPMADKSLMAILVACLAVKGTLPLWLAAIIFGRDASMALAAIYYRYASLPAPKTFARYWDFSLPSAEVHPTAISKYNTFLQLILIGTTTALPLVSGYTPGGPGMIDFVDAESVRGVVEWMQLLVAATTLWSGGTYIWRRDVVRILGDDEALKRKQGMRGRAILGITFIAFILVAAELARREKTRNGQIMESRRLK